MALCSRAAAASCSFVLEANLTLLGAPGSGKGFYGRMLAEAWRIPIYSASRILRQTQNSERIEGSAASSTLLDSGKLVDCQAVCTALISFLQDHHISGTRYIMDGFPRTRRQIDLMNAQWPDSYQIPVALHLNVTDAVCAQKMAGRRVCTVCHQEPNDADVRIDGFVLPPSIPAVCNSRCHPDVDWKRRMDDGCDMVIARRLKDYRTHERPLLDYYASNNSTVKKNGGLCTISPYNGVHDFPNIQQSLQDWFHQ